MLETSGSFVRHCIDWCLSDTRNHEQQHTHPHGHGKENGGQENAKQEGDRRWCSGVEPGGRERVARTDRW